MIQASSRRAPTLITLLQCVLLVLLAAPARAADLDGDGIPDFLDFCSADADAPRSYGCDSDEDGFGNWCDADLDGDGVVEHRDLIVFVDELSVGTDTGTGSDINCDGLVDSGDFSPFLELLMNTFEPGPSGLDCAGTPPCRARDAIPLSFDAPMFTGMVELADQQDFKSCESVERLSFDVPDLATDGVIRGGCVNLDFIRMNAREGIRVGLNGVAGAFTANNSYVDITAQFGDHADGLQAFGPSRDIHINNATFRIRTDPHTTAGYLSSSGWASNHRLTNVLFWGPGSKIAVFVANSSDVSEQFMYFNMVYFVKDSFGAYLTFTNNPGPAYPTIVEWNDVYEVRIIDDEIVLGDAIAPPCSPLPCSYDGSVTPTRANVPLLPGGALPVLGLLLALAAAVASRRPRVARS